MKKKSHPVNLLCYYFFRRVPNTVFSNIINVRSTIIVYGISNRAVYQKRTDRSVIEIMSNSKRYPITSLYIFTRLAEVTDRIGCSTRYLCLILRRGCCALITDLMTSIFNYSLDYYVNKLHIGTFNKNYIKL